jgi:hypothetical protein
MLIQLKTIGKLLAKKSQGTHATFWECSWSCLEKLPSFLGKPIFTFRKLDQQILLI